MTSSFRWLGSHRVLMLGVLVIALPFVPAVLAYWINESTTSQAVVNVLGSQPDAKVLSAWTYLQVATIAYVVFLSYAGPPNYLTAFVALIVASGLFMQQIGEPIGVGLAQYFIAQGVRGQYARAYASFIHHFGVGCLTWLMAWFITHMTLEWAQPTTTRSNRVTRPETPNSALHDQENWRDTG